MKDFIMIFFADILGLLAFELIVLFFKKIFSNKNR